MESIGGAVRDWQRKDRASWWAKYILALGAGLAGVRTADEAIGWYLSRAGVQTVEAATKQSSELQARIDGLSVRLEAKIDKLGDRIDAALTRNRGRR